MKEKLWVEKYRPTTLDDYVFSDERVRELCISYVEAKEFPHLLLSGIQGIGKTTLARILIKECELNPIDVKTINASSKTGIDSVRNGIENFCKTLPMGEFKVVLLEEADSLSLAAQKALRAIIEDSSDSVRFIFTCNYPEKIIEPLHSRLQNIHFTELDYFNFVKNIANIIENENVTVDNVDFVEEHISTYYPDMRKTINSIQQSSVTGTLCGVISKSKGSSDLEEWVKVWEMPPCTETDYPGKKKKMLEEIVSNMNLDNIDAVYRVMYDNVKNLPQLIRDDAIVVIAEHLYKSSFMSDQEINLKSCVVQIFTE